MATPASPLLRARATTLHPSRDDGWRRLDRIHLGLALLLIAVASAAGIAFGRPSPVVEAAFAAGLLATIGLPHGALDHDPARRILSASAGRSWLSLLLGFYALASGLVLAAWLWMPAATLGAFLIVLAFHFGDDARRLSGVAGLAERIAFGLAPVALPVILAPAETTAIFAWLTAEPATVQAGVALARWPLAVLLGLAAGIAALGFAIRLGRHGRADDALALGEMAAVALAFWLLPPLLAFALYFCALHAPRHLLAHARESALKPKLALGSALRRLLPYAFLVLAGALASALLMSAAPWTADDVGRLLVYGATALKTPHMLFAAKALQPQARG